ncbi:hypothetical protein ACIGJO_26715 [Streptomyces sp. NPDC079020]|uniref:hypothetical protein n=1 Tax=Streptomyces sp. NPDC079020 TaxID=3365722 RepID=UPI0037D1F574
MFEVVDPEGVESGRRKGKIAARWFYGIAVALVALVSAAAVNIWLTEPTVKAQKSAEKKVEEGEEERTPPFVARVKKEAPGEYPTLVLDRLLTETERKKLQGIHNTGIPSTRPWRVYLESLGAVLYSGDEMFSLTLFSEKKSGLSVTNMRAKKLRCFDAPGVTVFVLPPQGSSSVDQVYFPLPESDTRARMEVPDGENNGEPYFEHYKMDLGAGQSAGGLRFSALTEGESCEWNIEAEYRNVEGIFTEVIDNDGEPFVARGVPEDFEEYWIFFAGERRWDICRRPDRCSWER